ncbi:transglycosylase domain-containing protein [Bdellovibrio svalbardensis]|uniref:PBP1A family penicillin-binding protein n=1 Tax=Bdellovibrio svalbardensis TaxID=2972972 RepID=A0ABT6DFW0_9BACT|nr:PBP1A family penicillin-binding protein [Bdellovibrio svalbardensis]MDG0815394.1 PBP1A family penicillin-binding protein [Bdellovibrio svalbardensis]
MMRPRLKTILICFTILVTLVIITGLGFGVYSYFSLEKEMTQKLESKKFLIPTEYYAAPPTFTARTLLKIEDLESQFAKQSYRRRNYDQRLLPGDYFIASREECSARLQVSLNEEQVQCFGWVNKEVETNRIDSSIQVLVLQKDNLISQVFRGAPFQEVPSLLGEAPLLAQYIGNEPLMQKTVTLGEVPPMCSNAIMSIEDAQFLEHGGVSYKGILRALLKNLTHGRTAQGGSTITQQLVKNYFLTSERTLKRKFNEFVMSILLESRFSKDEILETYLNVIYMGQNGSFQVRGYGAASRHYFNKDVSELDLSECSLLAAIVNSPGLYNPFKKPENAERRRHLVLEKMQAQGFITAEQANIADRTPLPSAPVSLATETAPYYLDAVRKQMDSMKISPEGMRIFTALDLEAQQVAQESLRNHLDGLEKNNKYLKGLKEKGNTLEGSVLVGDNKTGLVSVVVGGRNYRMTQFNRAIDGHRQVGSIMKPFVYLTALMNETPEGKPYTPITLLKDEKFTTRYEGQSWSPDNYGNQYFGTVPMFFALKNSLNAATASLGLAVGLGNIVDITHKMGVESELKTFPSLTLGAFEMYPKEVLQSYMTLASLGKKAKLSFIRKVLNSENSEVYVHNPEPEQVEDPATVSSLVSMMKQTVLSGTARSVTLNGFFNPAAGKTGTTSDNKDAWFGGFTPYLTTVVWVGYDKNIPHKLTGTSGALPVWINFMKKIGTRYPPDDFPWPEGTEKVTLDEATLKALGAIKGPNDPTSVELIFRKGTEP